MTGRRRAATAVLALLMVVLTSSCVGIPTSTEPVAVTELPDDNGNREVAVEVLAPRGGELPDEIVQGFLAASASNVRSRPVARLYLTSDANDTWADDDSVTVIDDEPAALPDGALVTLSGDILGTVDADGVYTSARQTLSQLFSLVQVRGEWRISNPPAGVILRESDFRRAFVPDNLYFLDPTGTRVVPDLRWFLSGSPARANTLVEKLLQGPSEFLSPSVRSEFTAVSLASNVLETRNVVVDLTGLGERSPASLQGLSAQLVWTLKQLSFSRLTLRDDGRVLSVPDVGTTQTSDNWQSYDPDFVAADSTGHYVDQGAVWNVDGQRIPGPAGAGDYGLVTAGASSDQSQLAGVGPDPAGARLLLGEYGGPLTATLTAKTLSAPSWAGATAEVWTVRDGRDVVRVPVDAPAQVVSVSGLDPLPMRVLALSRDGTRAALVVGPSGRGQLLVGRISRTSSTAQLSGFIRLAADVGNIVAVSWATSTQVLFLGTDPADGRRRPWLASVDGAVLVTQSVANLPVDPDGIASAPGRPALVSAGGTMYQLLGPAWSTLVRGEPFFTGTAPFYPG